MAPGQVFAASGTVGQGVAPMEIGAILGHALPQQPWPERKGDAPGGGEGGAMGGKGDKGGRGSNK
eukprot:8215983-Pyramimonas_sp.AAC.1